jgi:hypothetical protein
MVWDRGPNESKDRASIQKQLTQGKIDVVFHGSKLRGGLYTSQARGSPQLVAANRRTGCSSNTATSRPIYRGTSRILGSGAPWSLVGR